MSIQQIVILPEFCLKTLTSSSRVSIMDSPISTLIANLFMEEFVLKPLALPLTPHFWLSFMDDTLAIHKVEHSKYLL